MPSLGVFEASENWIRTAECGWDAVTQVETCDHWFLPGSGPKPTDDFWLRDSPRSLRVMAPRAPEWSLAVTTSASAQKLSPCLTGRKMSWPSWWLEPPSSTRSAAGMPGSPETPGGGGRQHPGP